MVSVLFAQLHYLLLIASERIVWAFNISVATWVVALDISKAFDKFWHAAHLHKLKSYGISGWVFGFIYKTLICSLKLHSFELTLYLCKSGIWCWLQYYYHVWASALNCLEDMFDQLQKQVYGTVSPSLASSLENLV